MKRFLTLVFAALASVAPADAGIVLNASMDTNGAPIATIQRSPDQFHLGGPSIQETAYVGPFSVTAAGWSATGPFDAFCVDLWHHMGTSNPGISATDEGAPSASAGSAFFRLVSDPQVGNKMGFLMHQYAGINDWNRDQKGGFQLALWSLTDPAFRVLSTSTQGLMDSYKGILGLFDQETWLYSAQHDPLTAYNSSTLYGEGTLFKVTHVGNKYQDLLTYVPDAPPVDEEVFPTPEPMTLSMALTSLALVGFGRFVRRRTSRR